MWVRLDTVSQRDGQTDGRTDGQTDRRTDRRNWYNNVAICMLCMLTRARACPGFFIGAKSERLKAESGGGVLGEGSATFFPPAGALGCAVSSPQDSWQSPDRPKVFHYFQYSDIIILLTVDYYAATGGRPPPPEYVRGRAIQCWQTHQDDHDTTQWWRMTTMEYSTHCYTVHEWQWYTGWFTVSLRRN